MVNGKETSNKIKCSQKWTKKKWRNDLKINKFRKIK